MPTPKFDMAAKGFIARVPDEFVSPFNIGSLMPRSYLLPRAVIEDYVNRAMNKLFGDSWANVKGDEKTFIKIFPELTNYSDNITFTNGVYTLGSNYLNLFKVIGATTNSGNKFIKIKDEYKFTIYLTNEYPEYNTTVDNPVLIQVGNKLYLFPQQTSVVRLHYIIKPVNPITGGLIAQNGNYDMPFDYHWIETISDLAYQLYLGETVQTT